LYGTEKALEPVRARLNLNNESVDLINPGEPRAFCVRERVVSLRVFNT